MLVKSMVIVDGFQDWTAKLANYPQLDITVSPILNQNATAEDLAAHIDIANWNIHYKLHRGCHSERSPQGGVEES